MTIEDRPAAKTLPLIFLRRTVTWTPMKGLEKETPPSPVVEIRSIPGNVVAWGHNEEQATERLLQALNVQYVRAGSAESWWLRARQAMLEQPEDKVEASAIARHILFSLEARARVRTDHIEYSVVDVAEDQVGQDRFAVANA